MIVRHPWDAALSIAERFDVVGELDKYIEFLTTCNACVTSQLKFSLDVPDERFLVSKYEDLVDDPRRLLAEKWKFLGVKCIPDIATTTFQQPPSGYVGDPKIFSTHRVHSNSVDRWQRDPDLPLLRNATHFVPGLLDVTKSLAYELRFD